MLSEYKKTQYLPHGGKYLTLKYKYKYSGHKYEYEYKYFETVLEYKYKYQVLYLCSFAHVQDFQYPSSDMATRLGYNILDVIVSYVGFGFNWISTKRLGCETSSYRSDCRSFTTKKCAVHFYSQCSARGVRHVVFRDTSRSAIPAIAWLLVLKSFCAQTAHSS